MTTMTAILLAISLGIILGTALPMSCSRRYDDVTWITLFVGLGIFLLTLVFALGRSYAT